MFSSKKLGMHTAVISYGIIITYAVITLIATRFLAFQISKDEVEFWPTVLNYAVPFADYGKAIMHHNMIQNPLSFMLYGSLERLTGGGIAVARALNFTVSLLLLALAAGLFQRATIRSPLVLLALLLNPYFVGTSVYMYTDIFAIFFALAGVEAQRRQRYLCSFGLFFAAISCRQYMVAFPAALAATHGLDWLRGREPDKRSWLVPGLSCLALFFWFGIFGGLVPPQIKQHGNLETLKGLSYLSVFPYQALYFFTCLGVYYALPKALLEIMLTGQQHRESVPRQSWLGRWQASWRMHLRSYHQSKIYVGLVVLVLALLFIIFPPIKNSGPLVIETMGFFDRGVRFICGDMGKLFIFYPCAVLAILSVRWMSFEFILIAINAVLLMKAHIAWDKYALPVVVLLWFLWCQAAPNAGQHDTTLPDNS